MDRIKDGCSREDAELVRRALRATPERQARTVDTVLRRCAEPEPEEIRLFEFTDLLWALAEFCSATQYTKLADLAVGCHSPHDWARVATELFRVGTPQQRADLLLRCQPQRSTSHALLTRVIAARHEDEPERREALRDIMSTPMSHEDWCLEYCVPALQKLEPPERYEHCARLLREVPREGRRQTLERIRHLAPLIASFQTPAEVTSIIETIEEIGDWWP